MHEAVAPGVAPDSGPIYRLIRRTRQLLRSTWVLTGLGLTVGLLLGTLVAVALIDLLAPIPPMTLRLGDHALPGDSLIRLGGLLVIVVPAVWAFFTGVVRPTFRRLAPQQVARRIEAQLPGIHNRLVSCIDLETTGRKEKTSPVFYRRLLSEALLRIRNFRPRQVLDLLSLRHAAVFATVSTAALILTWYLFAGRLPTALARIFRPFEDIPPASAVAYTVRPGDGAFLREEDIPFEVRVTSADDPNALTVELYGDGGARQSHRLEADREDPKLWKCSLVAGSLRDGFENGFRYRVFGGGTWSKQHAVKMVERPVLVSVNTAVYYPDYMGIPEAHPTPPQAVEVTGPEGGAVEVVVEAQGHVARGEVQMVRPTLRTIPVHERADRVWFEDHPPVGSKAGGTWKQEQLRKRPVHTEPEAIGRHGHWFQDDGAGHLVGERDVLFAEVYLVPGHAPTTIMLQWHDGEDWEHAAYWGADRIHEGRAGTPSRHHAGALPAAGRWVRLEVEAAKVGLAGKTLRGMAFKLYDGQVYWGRSGTVQTQEPSVEVVHSLPMTRAADGRWSGRFPLRGTGLFRAELRSAEGHPNKPMKELKYVALPDKPPQVMLERHNSETVLSKPAALPLSVKAWDDYGLAEINLLYRHGPTGDYATRTLHRLPKPLREKDVVAALTEAARLPGGGRLHYAIEAKDRKGQTARTREFVVRIAADANAADQQLLTFDKAQDLFRERLVKLIAEQKKVKVSVDKLNKENAALSEKVETAFKDKPEPAGKPDPKTGKPPEDKPPKLDPETAKKYAELQKELARLSKEEEKNAKAAEELGKDFAKAAEQAGKLEMLPKPIVDEMHATTQAFDQRVAKAMRDLGKHLDDGGNPKSGKSPDLKGAKDKSDRLEKELEAMKNRLEALAKARKGLNDLAKALDKLRRDMLNEKGELTNRDLEALRDFIAKMRDEMKKLQDKQADLEKEAADTEDPKGLKEKQEDLNKRIEKMLADARHLLETKDKKKGDKPEFPDSPYTPDGAEKKVPPKEEDTDEPLPKKDKTGKTKGDKKTDKKPGDKDDEDKEPLYMPKLGGPKEKLDPRFAKKRRPVKRKPGDKGDKTDKEEMEDQAERNERELEEARNALGSDKESLDNLMKRLEDALKNAKGQKGQKGQKGDPQAGESDDLAAQLGQMLQDPRLQKAMAMAARMRKGMPSKTPGKRSAYSFAPSQGNLRGDQPPPGAMDSRLDALEPGLRAKILQLPPSRFREELIQGMSEQGPEAYRAFIQDYFKRLTDSKDSPKK